VSEEKMFSHIGPGNRIFIGTACGEPLLEYRPASDDEIAQRIGKYVAELIQDGDTIQVGYGSLPNAILSNLEGKKHLGVHSELLGDGIADLMKRKVIDNTQKTINRGKTVVSFCMGIDKGKAIGKKQAQEEYEKKISEYSYYISNGETKLVKNNPQTHR
jgi:acyl-CoA hydrolase